MIRSNSSAHSDNKFGAVSYDGKWHDWGKVLKMILSNLNVDLDTKLRVLSYDVKSYE